MKSFARYFPIDHAFAESSIYLTSAGRSITLPQAPYPAPGHPDLYQFDWQDGRVLPEFSLVLIEQGSGEWDTRAGSQPIRAGEVGLVLPSQWHRYRPQAATGWTESWVQFNGRLAHEWQEAGLLAASPPVIAPRHALQFTRQLQELLRAVAQPDFINSRSHGLRLAGLLGLLGDLQLPAAVPDRGLIEQARQHIWNHSHRQLSVVAVAETLGVSRRTLERAFTAETGTGVLAEITHCRMNRAERLLRETNLSIHQIAGLAGFGSAEQMRLHFRAKHHRSASEFRNAREDERFTPDSASR